MQFSPRIIADPRPTTAGDGDGGAVTVIIDPRALVRECLVRAMTDADTGSAYAAFPSVDAWLAHRQPETASLVIYCCMALQPEPAAIQVEAVFAAMQGFAPQAAIVVLANGDDAQQATEVIRLGARGYLSLNSSLDVTIHALKLIRAGGVYVPASLLGPARQQAGEAAPDPGLLRLFSPRELEVARALRKGQPNKVIALELGMSESTVKVHVRNIIRKLKVKNRTEVAFRTQGLFTDNH